MITTLTGDNQYLINAELNKLTKELNEPSDFSVTKLDGQLFNLEDIKLELSSYSLFTPKRLIILHEPSKIKGFDEYVSEMTEDIPESTQVVIVEPTLDKRRSYYKFLQSGTDLKQFNKLAKPALVKWIEAYIKEQGESISTSNADYLIDRVGDDQLLLSQELSKLILYSKNIDKDSIDSMTESSTATTIFELLDAAFNLNTQKALELYNNQRLQRVEPEQILAMLSWQLNTVAIYMASKNVPPSKVQSSSGLSPYTLTKAKQISTKLNFGDLKQFVSDLSSFDLRSKTTSFDLDEGLKNFIVSLSY